MSDISTRPYSPGYLLEDIPSTPTALSADQSSSDEDTFYDAFQRLGQIGISAYKSGSEDSDYGLEESETLDDTGVEAAIREDDVQSLHEQSRCFATRRLILEIRCVPLPSTSFAFVRFIQSGINLFFDKFRELEGKFIATLED